MRRRRALSPHPPTPGPARILIVSASMGAGHDGAARTLAGQLRADGHVVEVKDFLTSGPLRIGSALRSGYEFELRHAPSAYDATYRLWYRVPWLCPIVAWLVTVLTRRRVLRWVGDLQPSVVVSTYPLATLCLGRLRRTGRLDVPAVNFITDFGVHPLWVHAGIDLNLAVHDLPAQVAGRRTGRAAIWTGPAVSDRFDPRCLPGRDEARSRFGLAGDQPAVLVVAGSWGVGNVAATCEAVAGDGRFVPVVVCGRDDRLRQQLTSVFSRLDRPAVVLGWTDDMPALMAGCDALVENAGGLTSLEAMRAGLPVVSFDPIAGHGKENTAAMDAAGVARLAADPASLAEALAVLTAPGPARDTQVARAQQMFRQSPAELVLALSGDRRPAAAPAVPGTRRLRPVRLGAAALAFTGLGWAGLTTGVAMATEAGAGVARPGPAAGPVAYVGVRLSAAEAADPAVDQQLRLLTATAVVDDGTAEAAARSLQMLAADGVEVANGGRGEPGRPGPHPATDGDTPWSRAWYDARAGQEISELVGAPVTITVPGRRLNAWDLVECRNAHTVLVVPDHILHVGSAGVQPLQLAPREIYLVNGLGASPAGLAAFLDQLESALEADQLASAPLGALE